MAERNDVQLDELLREVNFRIGRVLRNDVVYHYTDPQRLLEILQSEVILPKTYFTYGERRVAWFSRNRHWENSVLKSPIPNSVKYSKALGMARIAINKCHVEGWKRIRNRAKIQPAAARSVQHMFEAKNAAAVEWCGTVNSIPASLWVSVEVNVRGAWKQLDSVAVLRHLIVQEIAEVDRQKEIASDLAAVMRALREDDPPKPKRKRSCPVQSTPTVPPSAQSTTTACVLTFE